MILLFHERIFSFISVLLFFSFCDMSEVAKRKCTTSLRGFNINILFCSHFRFRYLLKMALTVSLRKFLFLLLSITAFIVFVFYWSQTTLKPPSIITTFENSLKTRVNLDHFSMWVSFGCVFIFVWKYSTFKIDSLWIFTNDF